MYTPKNIPQKIPTGTNSSLFPSFPTTSRSPTTQFVLLCARVIQTITFVIFSNLFSSRQFVFRGSISLLQYYYNISRTTRTFLFIPPCLSLSLALAVVVVFLV